MKKLLIFLFSAMISFNSYANWELLVEDNVADGYIDKETIKEKNGYVYFWVLQNRHSPDNFGNMSVIAYHQGDCGIDRIKVLSLFFHTEPMGKGESEVLNRENAEWQYTTPDSISGFYLNFACNNIK